MGRTHRINCFNIRSMIKEHPSLLEGHPVLSSSQCMTGARMND